MAQVLTEYRVLPSCQQESEEVGSADKRKSARTPNVGVGEHFYASPIERPLEPVNLE